MAKHLITTIQVSLVLNPSETWRKQHISPELLLLKMLSLTNHRRHLLATTLDFTSFSTLAFDGRTVFYSLGVFAYICCKQRVLQVCKNLS